MTMVTSIVAVVLISAVSTTQFTNANDALPKSGSTSHICRACKAGDQHSCSQLVQMNKQKRINVCNVRGGTGDARYAPQVEYNENYFEGDIYQPHMGLSAVMESAKSRWSGAVIPYEFDETLDNVDIAVIRAAMEHLEENTCVRLRRRTDERSWVHFTNVHVGCFSAVGRVGGKQIINLAPRCLDSLGTPVHEMLHALGFIHEHTRPDRDEYVEVHWDNVRPGKAKNFKQWSSHLVDTADTQYDYGSVLHYPAVGFAIDPSRPTLTPKRSGVRIGQRIGLSAIDIEEVNAAYGCGGQKKNTRWPPWTTGPGGEWTGPYWTTRRPYWTRPPPLRCADRMSGCRRLWVACDVRSIAKMCPETCGVCGDHGGMGGTGGKDVVIKKYLVVALPNK